MKLHDLHPAPGSRRERTRVGRGIAAGKGKTAGRGTKGQRSRTGSSIPAWFEGGQTPIHIRVPKLHGFKNRFRVEYAVVNIGRIEAALTGGRLEPGPKGAPATVNAELLYAAGLLGRVNLPLKILGGGELTHPLLAIADAFSADARRKIEAAGGTAMSLEVPEASPAKTPRSRTAPPADDTAASGEADDSGASSPSADSGGRFAEGASLPPPSLTEGSAAPETIGQAEAAEVVETKPARRARKASAPAAAESATARAQPEATTATSEPEAAKAEPSSEPSPKPARRARKAAPESPAAESAEPSAAEAAVAQEAAESSESPEAPA